jgi:hypothetical protein
VSNIKKENDMGSIDYNDASNWIFKPEYIDKPVDVFYLYPTVFSSRTTRMMDITDPLLRNKAEHVTNKQIGVFNKSCNVFVPYYPQLAMELLLMPKDSLDKYREITYQAVKAAFLYYIENENHGRPFILAGHSQGSNLLLLLMKDLFSNSKYQEQLVASYLIGYSVTENDIRTYPWLKIAEKADDCGVIITYNTQSADATGSPLLLEGAQCINPLSWTRSMELAPKEMNLGAVFFDSTDAISEFIPEYTSARIDSSGALIADSINPDDYVTAVFPRGVYHIQDISFFYMNLQANVARRIMAYQLTH